MGRDGPKRGMVKCIGFIGLAALSSRQAAPLRERHPLIIDGTVRRGKRATAVHAACTISAWAMLHLSQTSQDLLLLLAGLLWPAAGHGVGNGRPPHAAQDVLHTSKQAYISERSALVSLRQRENIMALPHMFDSHACCTIRDSMHLHARMRYNKAHTLL